MRDNGMLQTGSPMPANASALPHAACGDHRRSHPIRGKTAHKKIPKLANDRDTNVIGGGGGIGLRRRKPIASWRPLARWTEAGYGKVSPRKALPRFRELPISKEEESGTLGKAFFRYSVQTTVSILSRRTGH